MNFYFFILKRFAIMLLRKFLHHYFFVREYRFSSSFHALEKNTEPSFSSLAYSHGNCIPAAMMIIIINSVES